jgi:hypothetical protein
MADEAMQEAADDAVATPLASPNLLLVLRDAQAQHGLRHNDYARYRCAAAARRRCRFCRSERTPARKADAPLPPAAPSGNTARGGCGDCTRCSTSRTAARSIASRTAC